MGMPANMVISEYRADHPPLIQSMTKHYGRMVGLVVGRVAAGPAAGLGVEAMMGIGLLNT